MAFKRPGVRISLPPPNIQSLRVKAFQAFLLLARIVCEQYSARDDYE